MTAQQWRDRAASAERNGDAHAAQQAMRSGVEAHPKDAALWNSAGNLFLRLGDTNAAAKHFGQAFALQTSNIDFAVNCAIALSAAARHVEALDRLEKFTEQGRASAVYCSTRGTAERGVRNLTQAAFWYDLAIALEPNRVKALHGRARVSLERGETTALQRFDRALSVNNSDADLWLGKAQALDVTGDQAGAREIADALANQAPQWTEGLRFLAQLRLAQGDTDFTSHYAEAAAKVPQDPNIPSEQIATLAGLGYSKEAAQIAATAHAQFPAIEHFSLLEAVNSGAAGDDDRAENIFSTLAIETSERHLHEARHRIRRGELDQADTLLDKVLHTDPWNITGWALQGTVWRLTGDQRAAWLHEQDGLAVLLPLHDKDRVLGEVIPTLHELHDNSPMPLGQSLRGGSQTRGILFDRTEIALSQLREAITATLETYQSQLPKVDDSHPLLRHRDAAWQLAGSWSVRLKGGNDFHTAHIHPQGIVSSALYCEIPDAVNGDEQRGWLELGRPPPDMRLDLPPIRTIKPEPGHLALFPSTMYHGTRPFPDGHRMTVAFDVTCDTPTGVQ